MANREQRSNREKRKPKKDKTKAVSATSPFSSVEAKAKAIKAAQEKRGSEPLRASCLATLNAL